MLSIHVDLGRGLYIISRNNGAEIVTKSINENGSNYYDKVTMEARRQELPKLMGVRWVPSEILGEVDTVLFDALQEFDAKYGTNYTKPYFDAVIEQVPFTGVSEKNKHRLQRARKLKTEMLEKAGISISYDVNLLGNTKSLKMSDVIRGFIVALKSKRNGANVKVNAIYKANPSQKNDNIILGEDDIPDMPEDDIPDMPKDAILDEHTIDSEPEESLAIDHEKVAVSAGEKSADSSTPAANIKNQSKSNLETMDEEIRKHLAEEVSRIMDEKATEGEVVIGRDISSDPKNIAEASVGQNNHKREPIRTYSQAHEANPAQEVVLEPDSELEFKSQIVSEPTTDGQAVEGKTERKTKSTSRKVSRSKSIQASKKASREAAKLKNTYQSRIAAKADRKAKAEEARIAKAKREEEEAKKAEEARIAREAEEAKKAKEAAERAEQERIKAEEEARIAAEVQKTMDEIMSRCGVRIGRKPKAKNPDQEKWVHKFTRKLKSKADSIKNKVYEHKERAKKIVIASAVGAVCLAAVIGIGLSHRNNQAEVVSPSPSYSASVEDNTNSTPPSGSDVIIDEDTSKPGTENVGGSTIEEGVAGDTTEVGSGTVVDNNSPSTSVGNPGDVEKPGDIENSGDVERPVDETEKDNIDDFLSSVRVGATINVETGRYYEAPDGTGRSGSFESFNDAVKRIEIIDVHTNEGIIVIRDGDISLAELKQQYPNAKFSYHIVAELPDGTTRTLGWMTNNSFENTIEQNMQEVDDGR